ncbi:hypothetical protein EV05_0996 [Prochlorococcus sp. MIT 0601]|nr:hypothetical protein EV05_0996 [Prochlorococcus sp. MIT 0601]
MPKPLQSLKSWLAEALEFTIGSPTSHNDLPPAIGPQPYRDKPIKIH